MKNGWLLMQFLAILVQPDVNVILEDEDGLTFYWLEKNCGFGTRMNHICQTKNKTGQREKKVTTDERFVLAYSWHRFAWNKMITKNKL